MTQSGIAVNTDLINKLGSMITNKLKPEVLAIKCNKEKDPDELIEDYEFTEEMKDALKDTTEQSDKEEIILKRLDEKMKGEWKEKGRFIVLEMVNDMKSQKAMCFRW